MTNPFRKASVLKRLFSFLVIVTFSLSFVPVASAGDDFDFSDDSSGEDFSSSGDFDFTDDSQSGPAIPAEKFIMPNNGKPVNLVFFEPVDDTKSTILDQLTQATLDHLKDDKYAQYDSVKAVPIKQKLDAMTPDERMDCTYTPECIADMGAEVGAANVIVGRIYTVNRERPEITFDLIDVPSKTTKSTFGFETQSRLGKQRQDIGAALVRLFGIDTGSLDDILVKNEAVSEGPRLSKAQIGAGVAVGVVALGAIGAGIYFGLQAKDLDKKVQDAVQQHNDMVNNHQKMDEISQSDIESLVTQNKAKSYADDASKNAMIANILFAGGAVAAVVSVIVFLIRSDKDEDIFATHDNLYISPALTGEGGGVVAGFSF